MEVSKPRFSGHWIEYFGALFVTCLCTAVASPLAPFLGLVNVVMIYLLGTTLGALRLQFGPAAMIAVLNTLAFDFLFVPPTFSFIVADLSYLITLGVMLLVALVIVSLMSRVREQRENAHVREQRTAVLYAMSRELAVATDARAMVAAAARHVSAVFEGTTLVFHVDDAGRLTPLRQAGDADIRPFEGSHGAFVDLEVAHRVVTSGVRCGTDILYVPLLDRSVVKAVMVVRRPHPADELPAEQLNLLDAFAAQLGLALARDRLARLAEAARISKESVLMRNTLLASISHDLQTPLSAIAGAGSLLAQPEYALDAHRQTTLGNLIERKAFDMSQLLTNVLEWAQMESTVSELRTEWHPIEDLVERALRMSSGRLAQRHIQIRLPEEPPFIMVEPNLIVKMISNLLENAGKYTPPHSTITISAAAHPENFLLVIEDDGPGLPPGDPERLFEKFQRGPAAGNIAGVGLGLAICRAAARLHGGDIRAVATSGAGARFEITLPVETQSAVSSAEV